MSVPEANSPNEPTNRLWDPILLFILGPGVAALNWWRMGWQGKVLKLFGATVLISLFRTWLHSGAPLTNLRASNVPGIVSILVLIIYTICLAFLVKKDINNFNLSGSKTKSIHWSALFFFSVLVLIFSQGMVLFSDSLASTSKHCRFPRLEDLMYEKEMDTRSGASILLINHFDTGCKVAWVVESENKPTNQISEIQTVSYAMAGNLAADPGKTLILDHYVEIHPERITASMFDLQFSKMIETNTQVEIHQPAYAKFYRQSCFESELEAKQCVIMLGYNHILTWFSVLQGGNPDSEFAEIMGQAVKNVDQRIYDYEKNILLVDQ